MEWCKKVVFIGGELQINSREELSEEACSSAFGSLSARGGRGGESREVGGGKGLGGVRGGRGKRVGELCFEEEEKVVQVLSKIHKGELGWAILAYSLKDASCIELVESGVGGAEELGKRWPTERIFFCPISVPMTPNPKYVLVTCVGSQVPPLLKARASGEVQKVADKVKSVIPFHAFFQPIDAQDLTDSNIKRKLT